MDRHLAMETFVRVVDTGSFSAAASQMRVGQPAVSKAIAQLEEWLGVRLLLRSTRSLTPTEAGMNFYVRAKRSIEEAEEAVLAARGAGAALTGKLRIAASVCFGRLHIMRQLDRFLEKNPELEIDMVLDDRPINLVEEGIDVAFRSGSLADSTLVARKLGQARRQVMATPNYFAKYGEPKSPAELIAHQTVIYTPDGGGVSWTFRQGSAETSVAVGGRLKVTAAEGLREAVFAHLGIAITSEWNFAPELASGIVKSVMNDWELPSLELWAVYPTGRMASAKAREFASFVETCIPTTPSESLKRPLTA
ncbi:LysR family transcriptional regulator [Bradyrhizobium sp. AZCC 2230]|uniref:LysR family transcriptional regulator n=1 Tax=Bradyrhizobium sp. AZCC 2230 TaxID=3117021 RepID=UPI002FF2C980